MRSDRFLKGRVCRSSDWPSAPLRQRKPGAGRPAHQSGKRRRTDVAATFPLKPCPVRLTESVGEHLFALETDLHRFGAWVPTRAIDGGRRSSEGDRLTGHFADHQCRIRRDNDIHDEHHACGTRFRAVVDRHRSRAIAVHVVGAELNGVEGAARLWQAADIARIVSREVAVGVEVDDGDIVEQQPRLCVVNRTIRADDAEYFALSAESIQASQRFVGTGGVFGMRRTAQRQKGGRNGRRAGQTFAFHVHLLVTDHGRFAGCA